jgi:hypothetical protein
VLAARYLAAAEEKFAMALRIIERSDKGYPDLALLRGEVLRRLGKWEDAANHFRDLSGQPEFQETKRQLIISQQMTLIARKDSQPQQLREPGAAAAAGDEPELLPDPEPISVRKPVSHDPK